MTSRVSRSSRELREASSGVLDDDFAVFLARQVDLDAKRVKNLAEGGFFFSSGLVIQPRLRNIELTTCVTCGADAARVRTVKSSK